MTFPSLITNLKEIHPLSFPSDMVRRRLRHVSEAGRMPQTFQLLKHERDQGRGGRPRRGGDGGGRRRLNESRVSGIQSPAQSATTPGKETSHGHGDEEVL